MLQIANVQHPNTVRNTIPICIFKEKDTPGNLETALGMYRAQVEELMRTSWRQKQIKVFFFGDYEFQCSNYGLSGASGTRPCLFCHSTKKDIQLERDQRSASDMAARTLSKLEFDHKAFIAAGSKLAQAKKFNNVIRPYILPVPVHHVIVPALHLDLGIFTWMYEALEKDVSELDLKVASQCASSDGDSAQFTKLASLHSDQQQVATEIEQLELQCQQFVQQIQFVALHGQGQDETIAALAQDLQQLYATAKVQLTDRQAQRQKLHEEIANTSKSKEILGPCLRSLEPVLQAHKIQRQVYHGGAFIGNHIHQALKPTVVTAITQAPVNAIRERCPGLLEDASRIAERYKRLFTKYAECRNIFSTCNSVPASDVKKLEDGVTELLRLCRSEIVARGRGHITPKLHLLEEHTVPLLRTLGVGIGLLGEQGAESIHAAFNKYEQTYKNIPSSLQRLKTISDQHLMACVMELKASRPQIRQRKRKASDIEG